MSPFASRVIPSLVLKFGSDDWGGAATDGPGAPGVDVAVDDAFSWEDDDDDDVDADDDDDAEPNTFFSMAANRSNI